MHYLLTLHCHNVLLFYCFNALIHCLMPTSDVDLYECHCAVQQYLRTIHDMVLFNNAALLHGKCDRTRRQTPRVL